MKNILLIEKRLLLWFKKRRLRIYLFTLWAFFLWLGPTIPYLNIVINYDIAVLLILASVQFLFNVSQIFLFSLTVFLFLFCLIFLLLNLPERADILANYIFGIILVQVTVYCFKENGKK